MCVCSYLDVELQVALVHLSRHHTLNDLDGHELVAVIRRAEDVVSFSLLDLHIQEPDTHTHTHTKLSPSLAFFTFDIFPGTLGHTPALYRHLPFPACSAELVATGHVHRVLEHRDGAQADATLQTHTSTVTNRRNQIYSKGSVIMIDPPAPAPRLLA